MNRPYRRHIRRGTIATLTGALTLLAVGTLAPLTAQAAITCTTANTMTGQHMGAVNVAGGQTQCLDNATQTGEITVDPNGKLSVRNSTVNGAVSLFSGFSEFEFCGSKTVGGAISATGGMGPVTIGNTASGPLACGPNTVGGAVTLDANQTGVTLARNQIDDAVTASGNLGGTKIAGNQIVGALTCTDNIAAPDNIGLLAQPMPNTVGGARFGQTCLNGGF
jgi:5'-nucleotidase